MLDISWVGAAASVELESNQDCIEKLNSVQAAERDTDQHNKHKNITNTTNTT